MEVVKLLNERVTKVIRVYNNEISTAPLLQGVIYLILKSEENGKERSIRG